MEKLTKVGDKYKTNSFGNCVVVECLPKSMVIVQFENTGNKETAYTVYRAMKEAYVKTLAVAYKDSVSEQVFSALSVWSVE